MAGGQERILRGRINSMQATKKITRAMELIAASRIVKAQQRVQAAVPYSDQITEVVRDLSAAGASTEAPLLAGRETVANKCYVVIAADRGLCGGYNSGVQRAAEGSIKADLLAGRGYEIIPVGRRAESYFKFREYDLGQSFAGFSDMPTYADAREIGDHVIDLFMAGTVDSVELIYTRFISAGSQEVVMRPLVPLVTETIAEPSQHEENPGANVGPSGQDYEYEPDPTTILETLLPRYVEARVYAALLNAAASEHAFRQRAMKAATDNADELIKNLSIIMNRARQDAITTEIMEIVGGAEALSSGSDAPLAYFEIDEGYGEPINPAPAQSSATVAEFMPAAPLGGAQPVADAAAASGTTTGTTTLERESDPSQEQSAEASVDEAPKHAVTESNPLGIRQVGDEVTTDDLELVKGIGPVLSKRLNGLGVRTFRQIAEWTPAEVDRIGSYLDFPGRIEREHWIAQAKDLHREHHGEEL